MRRRMPDRRRACPHGRIPPSPWLPCSSARRPSCAALAPWSAPRIAISRTSSSNPPTTYCVAIPGISTPCACRRLSQLQSATQHFLMAPCSGLARASACRQLWRADHLRLAALHHRRPVVGLSGPARPALRSTRDSRDTALARLCAHRALAADLAILLDLVSRRAAADAVLPAGAVLALQARREGLAGLLAGLAVLSRTTALMPLMALGVLLLLDARVAPPAQVRAVSARRSRRRLRALLPRLSARYDVLARRPGAAARTLAATHLEHLRLHGTTPTRYAICSTRSPSGWICILSCCSSSWWRSSPCAGCASPRMARDAWALLAIACWPCRC